MNDCYDKILTLYHEKLGENIVEINNETWVLNSDYLRKIVDQLDNKINNYEKMKNCLILLINLCFGIEDPDHYTSKGKSFKDLSNSEKEDYKTLLKTETNTIAL